MRCLYCQQRANHIAYRLVSIICVYNYVYTRILLPADDNIIREVIILVSDDDRFLRI